MEFSASNSAKRQSLQRESSTTQSVHSGPGPEAPAPDEAGVPEQAPGAGDAGRNISSGPPAAAAATSAASGEPGDGDGDVEPGDMLLLRYPAQVILLVDAANLVRQVDALLDLRDGAGGGHGGGGGDTLESRELHVALGLPKRLALLTQLKRRELDACTASLRGTTGAPLADSERHRLLHVLELLLLQKINQRDALSGIIQSTDFMIPTVDYENCQVCFGRDRRY